MKVSVSKVFRSSLGLLIAIVMLSQLFIVPTANAADLTTKYRVYEENRPIMEYASLDKAKLMPLSLETAMSS